MQNLQKGNFLNQLMFVKKLTWLFLIGVCTTATAQKISEFEGTVEVFDGKSGTATYQFSESRGSKVLNGNYMLVIQQSDSINQLSFSKESWSGTYKNNQRDGDWLFEKRLHDLVVKGIDSYQLQYDILSTEEVLAGSFDNGLHAANWKYRISSVKNGDFQKNLAVSDIDFSGGKVRSISYSSAADSIPFVINGRVNASGFLDSTWRFGYGIGGRLVEEVREYKDGFLLSLIKISDADTLSQLYYDDVRSKLELIEGAGENKSVFRSARHFPITFDHGYPHNFPALSEQLHANTFLEKILTEIADRDTSLHRDSNFLFASARFEYDPTPDERSTLNQIRHHFDSLSSFIHLFDRNRVFQLNEEISDSLAWISVFVETYKNRLDEIGADIRFMGSSAFRYVNPVIYTQSFSSYFPEANSISYSFKGERRTRNIDFGEVFSPSIHGLEKRLRSDLKLLRALYAYSDLKLGQVNRSEQMRQMEQMILSGKLRADSVFRKAEYNSAHAKTIAEALHSSFLVEKYALILLQYTNEQDFDEKLSHGYTILDMLDLGVTLPELIDSIYIRQKEIDDAYTVVKLDPYTFNYDFKTRKKKRIYESGAELLFGHYVSALVNETDYSKLSDRIASIRQLQERLMELLDEDTTQLEKKLRNEDNPQRIEALLSI